MTFPDSAGTAQPERLGLKANSMTWFGAALMGAVIMSPAGGIYFNFAPMGLDPGWWTRDLG